MKKTLFWLPLAMLLVRVPAAPAAGRSTAAQDIEAKVALESAVEARLQAALKKILSTDNLIVIVNVEMKSDSERRKEVELLPGVIEKETPGALAALEIPTSLVRRIAATIIVDESTSEANLQLAQKTAERMLGFNAERGDTLTVGKTSFQNKIPSLLDKLLDPKWFFSLSWLLLACAALFVLSKKLFTPLFQFLQETAKDFKAVKGKTGPDGVEARADGAAGAPDAPHADTPAAERNGANGRPLPFSFITEHDIPALKLLIREQTTLVAAAIVNYLPPALASQALSDMPSSTRQHVLAQMSRPMLLNELDVRKWEDSIRSKVDFILGGEDKLADILDSATVSLQAELLALIDAQDHGMSERLKKRIVSLDDIARLDEAGLLALSRQVPVRSLAAAIKFSEGLKAAVLPKLQNGLGEWLAQEIELSGDLPESLKQAEIHRVLKALSSLVRDGKVLLTPRPASASPSPAAVPHVPAPAPRANGVPPVVPPPSAAPAPAPVPRIPGSGPAAFPNLPKKG